MEEKCEGSDRRSGERREGEEGKEEEEEEEGRKDRGESVKEICLLSHLVLLFHFVLFTLDQDLAEALHAPPTKGEEARGEGK